MEKAGVEFCSRVGETAPALAPAPAPERVIADEVSFCRLRRAPSRARSLALYSDFDSGRRDASGGEDAVRAVSIGESLQGLSNASSRKEVEALVVNS